MNSSRQEVIQENLRSNVLITEKVVLSSSEYYRRSGYCDAHKKNLKRNEDIKFN